MFAKSFVGACIAGTALSVNLEHITQTPAALIEKLYQTEAATTSEETSIGLTIKVPTGDNPTPVIDVYTTGGDSAPVVNVHTTGSDSTPVDNSATDGGESTPVDDGTPVDDSTPVDDGINGGESITMKDDGTECW